MTRGLALVNLILQVALLVAAAAAFWLAWKRRLKRHCLVMRVAIGVQIVLIAALMAPAFAARIRIWDGWSRFSVEWVVHHSLGVIVVLLFIFFNLVMTGVIKFRHRLRPYMRTALVLWAGLLGHGYPLVLVYLAITAGSTIVQRHWSITLAFLIPSCMLIMHRWGLSATCRVPCLLVRPQVHPNECAVCQSNCGGVNEHGKVVRR